MYALASNYQVINATDILELAAIPLKHFSCSIEYITQTYRRMTTSLTILLALLICFQQPQVRYI